MLPTLFKNTAAIKQAIIFFRDLFYFCFIHSRLFIFNIIHTGYPLKTIYYFDCSKFDFKPAIMAY